MQSPKRLLEDDATPFERQLLEAVRGERPAPELSARMAQGLGFAEASSGASASSGADLGGAAASPAASGAARVTGLGGGGAGKLALPLLAGAAAIAGGLFFASQRDAAPRQAQSAAQVAPGASRAVTPSAREDSVTSSLREEIALVDELRAAVQTGRRERARELLRRHRERFVAGALTEEVEALRRRIDPGALGPAPPATEATSPR